MQRKMEFSAPGVQSRDRSWKKLYFILHGTSLTVYKFDPHRHPLKVDPHPPVPIVTEIDDEEYLHVHCPATERRGSISLGSPQTARRGSIPDAAASTGRRGSGPNAVTPASASAPRRSSVSSIGVSPASTTASTTSGSEKDPAMFPTPVQARRASVSTTGSNSSVGTSSIASHFQQNQLVKQYTLQNAESGLAADYVKRKNVVRVRSQGEQFLIQTDSARDVVDWIEVRDGTQRRIIADNRRSKLQRTSRWTWTRGPCRRSSLCRVDDEGVYREHQARRALRHRLQRLPARTRLTQIRQRATPQPLRLLSGRKGNEKGCWRKNRRAR